MVDRLPPGVFVVVSGRRVTMELRSDEVARPVAGGWPVIEVDTAGPVDVGQLVAAIHAAAATGLPG